MITIIAIALVVIIVIGILVVVTMIRIRREHVIALTLLKTLADRDKLKRTIDEIQRDASC